MNTRIFVDSRFLRHCVSNRVKYGRKRSFPIDQSPSMPFNIDPDTGRPMSDIQKLVKIQNDVQQQALLSQLPEMKSNFMPSDMTDTEALQFMKSRYCQTRSELLDWRESLAKQQLTAEGNRLEKERQRKLQADALEYFKSVSSKQESKIVEE